jgi:murein L,D-transpeptidase YcbB/YkuD
MLDYARQAQSGRMHWSQVSGDIQYPEHPIDPAEVLANVTTAKDASLALDSYNPPQKLYRELKAKLAELRGQGGGPVVQIAEGPALRFVPARGKKQPAVASEDPRVPQLRAKLGISENADDTHYDAKVAEAVRKFQEGAELKPTGILDDKTVKAINSPKRDKQIDTVIVNMERWRWLPRQLGVPSIGNAYVILNIPDYTLKVMQNGAQVWTTRVVTGQPGIHATPLLTETMKFITVNPTWNVPPSIIYKEYLPALQQDPTVLQRMGLKLERARDGSIHISQPPGEGNALGRIRFNFPNKFLVYQHDTPDKYLFAKEERAFSHGCMRVQNPDQYAATLLGIVLPKDNYTAEKIRSMYGRNEVNINFPTPIPVNITYQTAFVDDAGKLEFRKDVYGRDATMIGMLKGGSGKDLEAVVAHSQPNYVRPTRNLNVPGDTYASNNSGSGLGFFERLFGAPTPPPAPVRGRRIVR